MNNQFSENLKKIRKEHNLSQEQLADELGVSRQAISKWESSVSYPEMDKIIALCDKFNLNIDDLLHRNIKEIKEEEESKKTLNKTVDTFLKFITDTINLFSNMKLKSKIKCLFEQVVIGGLLTLISVFIIKMGCPMILSLLDFLPFRLQCYIDSFFNIILILFCIISSVVILTHVFKVRYLDYYDKLKKNKNIEHTDDLEKINDEKLEKPNKILFRKNESKIIIRDAKHSEYRFINSLFKLVIGIIKFFALCFTAFIFFILIFLCASFILSFLVYKTGVFFIGLLITILSSSIIVITILLIILNFIFNRKNDKKKIILLFIISFALLGCGVGLIIIGSLHFEVSNNNDNMLKTETFELEMTDHTFFNIYADNIQYIESNIDNIKVEYQINKYCELTFYHQNTYDIEAFVDCPDPIKLTKEFISNINHKKIVPINNEIKTLSIYASKENIEKLKNNERNYFDIEQQQNKMIDYYEERIQEFQLKINDYERKLAEYEEENSRLNSMIENNQLTVES